MLKKILICLLTLTILLSTVTPCTLAVGEAEVAESEEVSKPETKAAATWDIDGDGTLEILAIGNSFSVDALQYVWNICRSLGISKIVLGNLYIGGCSLNTHVTNITNDSASYTYYYNDSGTWTNTKSYKISTAVKSRSWDFISMQQASGDSGVESTYSKLGTLISKVKSLMGTSAQTKLVWHMTWAYQSDSTHSAFATYNKNQTTMYNAIITAVTNKIQTNSNFDRIIPSGTAVQNMRSSVVGDKLTRDGYHMSYDLGRFLVGLMFVKSLTGLDISKNTYVPDGVSDTNAYIAVNAVNKAYSTPMKVSKSVYNGNNPSSGYIELVPTMTKGAYWYSTSSTYNKLITSSDINHRYWATHRFTKSELPVGTIILAKSGWQYRPEGWVTDAKQSSREGVVSDKLVVVTDNWWKNYTLRAFNISKTDNSDLTSMKAADVLTNFRIFVPESIYLKDHIQIKPDLHKGAYWHPLKSGSFNVPITSASNSPNFFCTPRFTKAQLPVGSVILVKSSYQYRPDGWVKDELQTGTREDIVTRYSTIVSSSWWGSYTLRGFNISLTSGDVITGKTQDDIYKNFKIYVPKSSHTHTAASSPKVTAPTCTAQGYTTYTCTMCKQTYTGAQTAALGHSVTTVVTPPTCTAQGYSTHTCTRCNQVTVGDYTTALGHNLVSDVVPPSCTTDGYTTFTCTRCNEVTTGDITAATGHSIQSVVTPATCTEGGYTTHTCTICNQVTVGDYTTALGHNLASDVVPPSCTTDGYTTFTCTRCNEVTTGDITAATGHSIQSVVTPATCTEGGYTTHTCTICNQVTVGDYTTALGHNLASDVVPPSCTTDGYTTFTCTRCNEVTTGDITAATGHSIQSVVTPATCTEGGYTTHTCTICNATTVGDETPALDHALLYTSQSREQHEISCSRCSYSTLAPHVYTDGFCICGEAEIIAPIPAPEINIYHSLNLASDISINFVVPVSDLEGYDMDTVYMECMKDVYEGNTITGSTQFRVNAVKNGNYYYFTLNGLTAVQMNDRIYSVLHGVKAGQPYYSETDEYSIASYAYSQLKNSASNLRLKTLCSDLLRYGAEAQTYKTYRTDALVDRDLTAEQRSYQSDMDSVVFGNTNRVLNDVENPTILWKGKALSLESKVCLKLIFSVENYTGATEDLSLRVSYQDIKGVTKTLTLEGAELYSASYGLYAFTLDSLLATELRNEIFAQVYVGDVPVSDTLVYTADTYCANKTGALGELCKALMAYSDSAKAFFLGNTTN